MKIQIGILGYGNLGRGARLAVAQNDDMEVAAIFTRRDAAAVAAEAGGVPVLPQQELLSMLGKLDVLLLCGSSAKDLPADTPHCARMFNFVDSFDIHGQASAHFAAVDREARAAGHVGVVSAGWDPGLFSLARVYAQAFLPQGNSYTFWGRGVSQGHSAALRQIDGVVDACQFTVPKAEALRAAEDGGAALTAAQMHRRECYVAAAPGADHTAITRTIRDMADYFLGYETAVYFVSPAEVARRRQSLAHAGRVLRSGRTGEGENGHSELFELRLTLGSNPEFTGCILAATARAVYRLAQAGARGCRTMADLAPALYSPLSPDELREKLL